MIINEYGTNEERRKHTLDGKDPAEGDGGQCTSDDGAGGVTNGKEDEEDGLLPVVFVEGAGVG